MKELRCADVMPGCKYVATGATDDEVMKKAVSHARDAHKIKDVTPDLAAKVRAAIRSMERAGPR
jgi:predicted small metal-binding protein